MLQLALAPLAARLRVCFVHDASMLEHQCPSLRFAASLHVLQLGI
jgi:hypothetical protein